MIQFILIYLFIGTIWCMFMEEMSGEPNPKWKDRFRWALFWPFPVIAFFIGFTIAFKKALEEFFDDLKNN
jgi:predicted permease